MQTETPTFSIIVPCYNEEEAIAQTVEQLVNDLQTSMSYELIVVNDGSTDGSAAILERLAQQFSVLKVVEHEANHGYGASLKTGIRHALADYIAITDADGTYPNERIPELVEHCQHRDMVVGARTGEEVTYSRLRALPKVFLRLWISWLANRAVPDINSGMRVFRKDLAEQFIKILPDSFSFTITITLAMLTTHRIVEFVPINYTSRVGKSKIKPVQDTLRFIMLILRTGTYFAPLRVFTPVIALLGLAAFASLCYDSFVLGNLTDKTVLLSLFAMNTGMFALLGDMIVKRTSL